MKRFALVLLGGLLFNTLVAAQTRLGNFNQRGAASQEMKTSGLTAAHPSLPIGSKVKVTNTQNGKETEVTITGRIPASSSRIVDLSPDVLQALEMAPGETVVLSVGTPPRPAASPQPEEPAKEEPAAAEPVVELAEKPAAEPKPEEPPAKEEPAAAEPVAELAGKPAAEPKPEEPPAKEEPAAAEPVAELAKKPAAPPKREEPPVGPVTAAGPVIAREEQPKTQESVQPVTITVNNYMGKGEDSAQTQSAKPNSDTEFLAWLTAMSMDARESRETRESREVREAREAREARETRELRRESTVRAAPPTTAYPQPPVIQAAPAAPAPSYQAQTAPVSSYQAPPVPPQAPPAPAAPVYQAMPPVPAGDLQIIPGLPDQNSGKIYRLQIGAYSAPDMAVRIAQQMQTVGFNAAYEQSGAFYRVLVTGIAAADVYAAAVRLGSMGFRQIWVRE
ncbi:hypothetical protein AGMMS50293_27750 [Spirochaetia bacterium]|nr:hypothetical protein AGMMS50293_27750 [Spirochaetia bacterium]